MITPEEAKILEKLRDDMRDNARTAFRLGVEKKELMSKHNREHDLAGISVDRNLMILNVAYQSYFAESTTYEKCAQALDAFLEEHVLPF